MSPLEQSDIPEAEDALVWCIQQAQEIMTISAGCATTHGDPGGGLEMVNRIASDIAINLEMLASAIAQPRSEPIMTDNPKAGGHRATREILKRRALEYHQREDRGPSCGSMAIDMELIFDGLVTIAPDSRLELTDAGRAHLQSTRSNDRG